MLSLAEAVRTLDGLRSDQIAALLRERYVTGQPQMACKCPLAIYLSQLTGALVNVAYTTCWTGHDVGGDSVKMSQGMSDFVNEFDGGDFYQDLVKP
jgi:hypothetical protein